MICGGLLLLLAGVLDAFALLLRGSSAGFICGVHLCGAGEGKEGVDCLANIIGMYTERVYCFQMFNDFQNV